MLNRSKSFDDLYDLTRPTSGQCMINRSESLPNIHLHINLSWFMRRNEERIIKRSQSCPFINHQNIITSSFSSIDHKSEIKLHDDSVNIDQTPSIHRSTNQQTQKIRFLDDHNLPSTISADLFNVLMHYEKNRLRTFKNWPLDYVTASDLSKAGFYYLLDRDCVRCFECRMMLFNWERGDQAIIEHYKNNPLCRLLNGYNVNNVPLDKTPLDVLRDCIDLDAFKSVKPNETITWQSLDECESDEEECAKVEANEMRFESCTNNIQRTNATSELDQCAEEEATTIDEDQLFELMRDETTRLSTFDTWPEHLVDKVRPVDLAQCGFFYTAIRDKVLCAFCRTPAWDWSPTDVPVKEHYKHNCACPLLNDEICGNQPIKPVNFKELLLDYEDITPCYSSSNSTGEDELSHYPFTNSFSGDRSPSSIASNSAEILNQAINNDQTSSHRNSNQSSELSKPPDLKYKQLIVTHKQAEKYYTCQNRLQTFDRWPVDFVKKTQLADAGFFYLGFGDQVKCFSCDLVLSDWSKKDDPWIEHCKYNNDCEYLKLLKGNHFIVSNQNKANNSPKRVLVCNSSTASSSSSDSSSSDVENENQANFDEDVKNFCKICMIKEANILYLPCSHLVTCASCTIALKDCPLCRTEISSTVRAFIS